MSHPQPFVLPAQQLLPDTRGRGAGIMSIVGFLSLGLTALPSTVAPLLTRSDGGSNGLAWVAPAVLLSLPTLFGIVSAATGIAAVSRAAHRSTGWTTGVVGLSILGAEVSLALTLIASQLKPWF